MYRERKRGGVKLVFCKGVSDSSVALSVVGCDSKDNPITARYSGDALIRLQS